MNNNVISVNGYFIALYTVLYLIIIFVYFATHNFYDILLSNKCIVVYNKFSYAKSPKQSNLTHTTSTAVVFLNFKLLSKNFSIKINLTNG